MYNGIGLATARGSGTNGYVQKNMSYVRPHLVRQTVDANSGKSAKQNFDQAIMRQGNEEILDHARKRKIEVKLYELRVEMEDRGCATPYSPSLSSSYFCTF